MLLIKLSLVLLAAATTSMLAAAALPPQAKAYCPDRCGNLKVPYPYGIGDDCHIQLKGQERQYNLTCDHSKKPPSLNWTNSEVTITNFSLDEGELQITNWPSKDCYNENGWIKEKYSIGGIRVHPPLSISGPKNKFIAVGCDTRAYLQGYRDNQTFLTGCMSGCNSLSTVDQNSCSGVGCCQTNIPDGLKFPKVSLSSNANHRGIWSFNPCSYAFIVQDGYFNFSRKSFEDLENIPRFPMIVNFAIGSETCDVAKNNTVDYPCKGNSTCVDHNNTAGSGYYCQCSKGYEGNPYLGCQDIDECSAEINPCRNGTCQNSPGSYSCKCNKGFKSDGPWNCIAPPKANNTPLKFSLGICISFFVLLVGIFWIYRENKRRKFNQLKEKYFEVNGGPKLKQELASQKESLGTTTAQIFKAEELKKATNDYNESRKIGEGGYGIVYKGILDEREVAIKTSKMSVQGQSDQFANEVIVLSQISHKNVVKLLGCCLETEMPLLVYEFVNNGTLYEHIHKKNDKGRPLSLEVRLKIAVETASALSYLHHSTSPPIVHRDVKATNILLDEKFSAKVSDFGASRLVPEDPTQLSTLVQGTMGYLDPEYLQSNTLTEKSDVYSFGVVLVELLTSKTAVSFDKHEAERNLANVFVSTFEKGPLDSILDNEILKDGNGEIITKVAILAKRCLSVKGDERPTMKYVERELDGILQSLVKQPGGKPHSSSKETDHSFESRSNSYVVEVRGEGEGGSTSIITSAEYDASMQNQTQMLKPFGNGR